jgi:nitrate reductase (NAD(P)H)
VAKHNKATDAWIIVDNKVHDITDYVDEHPGGSESILVNVGGDATKGFHGEQHPATVHEVLARMYIGDLKE